MKQTKIKPLTVKNDWKKLLAGILAIFVALYFMGLVGVGQLQKYIASSAPNPPSQVSVEKTEIELGKK